MAQSLNILNFRNNNITKQVKLTEDIISGVTSLPVNNSADFASGFSILLGNPGSTTGEFLFTAPPTNSVTVTTSAGTQLPHNNGELVSLIFGNSINIYRATDLYGTGQQPPDVNFSKIDTVVIDPTSALTSYTDVAGVAGNWYKYTYFNPTLSLETSIADSMAVQAGAIHYVSLDQVRRAAGFTNSPNVTDDIIAEKRYAAEREINGRLTAVYAFPLPQPTNPIVEQIALNIAAGELKHEMYQSVSQSMANEGAQMAKNARNGGGEHTSLDDLVYRVVALEDATFAELTLEEGHGFGGWPDETTEHLSPREGGDHGQHFTIDKEY